MNNLYLNRFSVTTGIPNIGTGSGAVNNRTSEKPQVSFREVLQNTLESQQSSLTFSKHAVQRVEQRGIEISESNLARLNEGVRLAEQKGLNDTLILVDGTAFLVNVKSSKVITTVNNEELKGNVFTNIDGTVII
ncbi:MAG: flagellar protein [Oscillospiraceae bacterium]|nr:flagellar protein [Oscillospiraceae bacterium]